MRIVKLYAACRPFFLCIAAAGEGHQRFLSSFAACRPIHHAVNELHRNPERSSCATANAAARTATASATVFDVCQCWPIVNGQKKRKGAEKHTQWIAETDFHFFTHDLFSLRTVAVSAPDFRSMARSLLYRRTAEEVG